LKRKMKEWPSTPMKAFKLHQSVTTLIMTS
jgi:hypothetical protein